MSPDPDVVLRQLRAAMGEDPPVPLWAVLDGARDESIHPFVRDNFDESACLYSGAPAQTLQSVAPYLVRLRRDDPLVRELVARAWGNSWGVFFVSDASQDHLRRHLRYFLRVRDEQGRHLLFRFYDPRVLRVYLPTCTSRELWLFFGAISAILVEGEDPGTLLQFRYADRRLYTESIDMVSGSASGEERDSAALVS